MHYMNAKTTESKVQPGAFINIFHAKVSDASILVLSIFGHQLAKSMHATVMIGFPKNKDFNKKKQKQFL